MVWKVSFLKCWQQAWWKVNALPINSVQVGLNKGPTGGACSVNESLLAHCYRVRLSNGTETEELVPALACFVSPQELRHWTINPEFRLNSIGRTKRSFSLSQHQRYYLCTLLTSINAYMTNHKYSLFCVLGYIQLDGLRMCICTWNAVLIYFLTIYVCNGLCLFERTFWDIHMRIWTLGRHRKSSHSLGTPVKLLWGSVIIPPNGVIIHIPCY